MKTKFELEYELKTSPKVLYNRLSTPSGLSEWFADDVNVRGEVYSFYWEGSEQKAQLLSKKDKKQIRFKWEEDEEEEYFFEFLLNVDEITGDVALVITDFAEEDEKDDVVDLWDTQIGELKRLLGI